MSTTNKILLIIDVQSNMLADPPAGVPARDTVKANITHILDTARAANARIVHVRHNGDPGEPEEPNTPGWHLVFTPKEGEPLVDKRECNSFAGTNLADYVGTDAQLVVVGMQSDYCIRETCKAAVERGNKVYLVRGAHATYDGENGKKAGEISTEIEEELEKAGVILTKVDNVPSLF